MGRPAAVAPRAGIRGAAVGAVSGTLAIGGHSWAAHTPTTLPSSSLALLLVAVAVAGVGPAALRPLRASRAGLLIALLLGQLAGHTALSAGSGHGPQLTWLMLGAHLAAALAAGLVILGAERGYRFGVAVVTRLLPGAHTAPSSDPKQPANATCAGIGPGSRHARQQRTRAPPTLSFA